MLYLMVHIIYQDEFKLFFPEDQDLIFSFIFPIILNSLAPLFLPIILSLYYNLHSTYLYHIILKLKLKLLLIT